MWASSLKVLAFIEPIHEPLAARVEPQVGVVLLAQPHRALPALLNNFLDQPWPILRPYLFISYFRSLI